VIEEAIKSVEVAKTTPIAAAALHSQPSVRPDARRPPPLTAVSAQPSDSGTSPASRRASALATGATPLIHPPTKKSESWRSKASPLPPLSATRQAHSSPSVPSFLPPPPSALEQVNSLADNSEENLEIVDFSDMGKFVGAPEPSDPLPAEQNRIPNLPINPSRPVASDFFDELTLPTDAPSGKSNLGTWRQSQPHANVHDPAPASGQENEAALSSSKGISLNDVTGDTSSNSDTVSTTSTKEISFSAEQTSQTILAPPYTGHQRTPRTGSFYKEATMSALDDAMSRIKGALDGMQASEQGKEMPRVGLSESDVSITRPALPHSSASQKEQKERWVPPALRSRNYDYEPREVFQVTGIEPPRSPKPAWNAFVIKLPSTSQALEPVNKKQVQLSAKPVIFARWDTLSFEPPVEGMNRRDFSLNDALFRKQPGGYRGKPRFRVMLPRFRPYSLGPRVNIPANSLPPKINGGGAFGRPTAADGVTTWRKAPLPKSELDGEVASQHGLSTMSRSPPPDVLNSDFNSTVTTDSSSLTKPGEYPPVRSRLQPKMPAGSAVAFYRDSRIDTVEEDPKPSVNFIVTSELEESRQGTSQQVSSNAQPNITITSSLNPQPSINDHTNGKIPLYNGIIASTSAENAAPALVHGKAESKSSEDSVSLMIPTYEKSTDPLLA
jgi:serine/arginine repetitive matrix protein 2